LPWQDRAFAQEKKVRIDPGRDQFVVKSRRHREDQPVLDHGMGRWSFDLPHMLHLGIADLFFLSELLRAIGEVRIQKDPMMEKSPSVNLA